MANHQEWIEHYGSPIKLATTISKALQTPWSTPPHINLINQKLFQVAQGKVKRLIIEAPPRHGKTELVCRWFPFWFLSCFPDRHLVLSSYGASLAADQGRWVRNLWEQFGASVCGLPLAPDSTAVDDWSIAQANGSMRSVGVGGPILGKGAHCLIIDDPVKNAEEAMSETYRDKVWSWWQSTARTRLEPGGSVIVTTQRWHRDDLVGRLLRQSPDSWEVLSFPAIAEEGDVLGRLPGEALWPARYPVSELEAIKRDQELRWWLAQYQQRPGDASHENAEWPADYFQAIYTTDWPKRHEFGLRVMALDPSKGANAKRGDYSAIICLGVHRGTVGYVAADLARRDTTRMVSDLIDAAVEFKPDAVGIETNGYQFLLRSEIDRQVAERGLPPLPIFEVNNSVKKEIRISRLGPLLANGELRVLDNSGGRLLVEQLREFPLARHDDGPDALEMAVRLAGEVGESAGESWSDNLGSVLPGCRVL